MQWTCSARTLTAIAFDDHPGVVPQFTPHAVARPPERGPGRDTFPARLGGTTTLASRALAAS